MDRADLELFTRSLVAATSAGTGEVLDAALNDLGWRDALGVDRRAAVAVLFDLQGRANARSSALNIVMADALGLEGPTPVVLPALGGANPPGSAANGRVTVHGLLVTPVLDGRVVVVAGSAGYAVPVAEQVSKQVVGLDPGAELVEIVGEASAEELGPVDWEAAVRVARLAVASETLGASRRMLDLAREHALGRVQYGVPIASFQAVRHHLADALVAIEMAEAGLNAAWIDDAPHHAIIAKALAGRAGRVAAGQCQQVLAGIGYTQEHPFHLYFRRVLLLDELFGSFRSLTRALGEDLLRTKQLPPLLGL